MKTCLVVDDSSVIRKIASRILGEMDFRIVEAEDGEKALEACKRELPDAVLPLNQIGPKLVQLFSGVRP